MAIATVTATEWGYSITGDTDATLISAERLRVVGIGFSGNADNAVAVLTAYKTKENHNAISFAKFKSSDTGELNSASGNYIYFGPKGLPVSGLTVTLGNGGSHLYVYVK